MVKDLFRDIERNKEVVVSALTKSGLSFAIITGKFEKEGSLYEFKNNRSYVPDIDIIIFEDERFARLELLKFGFRNISGCVFEYCHVTLGAVHIDVYFEWLSVGIIKVFKPSLKDCVNLKTCESDYLLYQLIEPLLKFGEYKDRHVLRITLYKENDPILYNQVRKRLFWLCLPLRFKVEKYLRLQKLSLYSRRLLNIIFVLKPRNVFAYVNLKFNRL